ncbi:simple sugar transport system permease protein [Lachnospiraceae bacterium XPB1003]|nr:simple sugar transport system permease protein [Lachnospiraceae bacterium XPB1003]
MSDNSAVKDPFVRVVKRDGMKSGSKIAVRIASVIVALIVCGILINMITGLNPLVVYETMFQGAFGSTRRSFSTIREMMMLACVAIGLAPAFKMKFWNIGAEGQILIGGIVSAACMINLNKLPAIPLLLIMFVLSAVAGALWALLPAIFKAKWNTNETLFTLMMNYVAIQLTSFFVSKWENPKGSNTVGIINSNTQAGWFPEIFGQKYTLNIIMVITLAILMWIYLKYTKHGYEIAVVGDSENTARYAGINVSKVIIRTMLLSGAICGIAGFLAVSGASHTISTSTAGGRGFTAIIVAWLAKFNSFYMLLIALLLAFLGSGATEIASKCKLNDYASDMIIGIILFFILASEFFINYRLVFRKHAKEEA